MLEVAQIAFRAGEVNLGSDGRHFGDLPSGCAALVSVVQSADFLAGL